MQDESTKLSFILLYYLVDSNSRLACIFIFSDNFIVYYNPKKLLSLYSTLPVYRYRAPVDGTAYSTSVASVHGHLDVPFRIIFSKKIVQDNHQPSKIQCYDSCSKNQVPKRNPAHHCWSDGGVVLLYSIERGKFHSHI